MIEEQDVTDYQKLKIQIDTLNISDKEKDALKWRAICDLGLSGRLSGVKSRVRELKLKEVFGK